jgi:NtrC-family two-component system response regulator AlgB
MSRPTRVLVVEDERNIRTALAVWLRGLGCVVSDCGSSDWTVEVGRNEFDLALAGVSREGRDGLNLINRLRASRPGMQVVVMSVDAAVETVVEAMRRGAVDYLVRPLTPAPLRRVLDHLQSTGRPDQNVIANGL